jgi:drug/metabolite transporter (DMT)-like permease
MLSGSGGIGWVLLTLVAVAAQTARNALQRSLVAQVGTVGATHVRFMFGLPFAFAFLALVYLATSDQFAANPASADINRAIGSHNVRFWIALVFGAVFQILATAFMLSAMKKQSFVVVTAMVKTEPLLVALFGVLILGDHLSVSAWIAILMATAGVLIFSWPSTSGSKAAGSDMAAIRSAVVPGLLSASCFAISVTGFRGAVVGLDLQTPFYVRAILVLAAGQCLQTFLLSVWLRIREPGRLSQLFVAWKPSLIAGFFGATASAFWYMAFGVETAAKVRTLGLVEILLALVVSKQMFKQTTTALQLLGLSFLLLGLGWLLLN